MEQVIERVCLCACSIWTQYSTTVVTCTTHCHTSANRVRFYRLFNLKVDRILIWVIYLLKFTTCYITQLTCIYSKCWKWCPLISMHLSTRFTMFLATSLSVLSFISSMARVIFIFNWFRFRGLLSKFFKKILSTVGVRYRFTKWIHVLPLLTALWKRKKWRCSKTSTHCRLIQLIRMAKTGSPLSRNSLANSCTCSSIMSYQQNHYK